MLQFIASDDEFSPAFAAMCGGSRHSCFRSLSDEIKVELSKRPEDVKLWNTVYLERTVKALCNHRQITTRCCSNYPRWAGSIST